MVQNGLESNLKEDKLFNQYRLQLQKKQKLATTTKKPAKVKNSNY
jgi:hypothetical protein